VSLRRNTRQHEQRETVPEQRETVPEQRETVPEQRETVPEQRETVPEQRETASHNSTDLMKVAGFTQFTQILAEFTKACQIHGFGCRIHAIHADLLNLADLAGSRKVAKFRDSRVWRIQQILAGLRIHADAQSCGFLRITDLAIRRIV
jgi:hypothetical protein